MQGHVHMCANACGGQRSMFDFSPPFFSTLFFETGPLSEPRTRQMGKAGWPVIPGIPSSLSTPSAGVIDVLLNAFLFKHLLN